MSEYNLDQQVLDLFPPFRQFQAKFLALRKNRSNNNNRSRSNNNNRLPFMKTFTYRTEKNNRKRHNQKDNEYEPKSKRKLLNIKYLLLNDIIHGVNHIVDHSTIERFENGGFPRNVQRLDTDIIKLFMKYYMGKHFADMIFQINDRTIRLEYSTLLKDNYTLNGSVRSNNCNVLFSAKVKHCLFL